MASARGKASDIEAPSLVQGGDFLRLWWSWGSAFDWVVKILLFIIGVTSKKERIWGF